MCTGIRKQAYQSSRRLTVLYVGLSLVEGQSEGETRVDILRVGHHPRFLDSYHNNTNSVLVILVTLAVGILQTHQINVEYVYFSMYLSFVIGCLASCAKSMTLRMTVMFLVVFCGVLSSLACWWPLAPQLIVGGGITGGREASIKGLKST